MKEKSLNTKTNMCLNKEHKKLCVHHVKAAVLRLKDRIIVNPHIDPESRDAALDEINEEFGDKLV